MYYLILLTVLIETYWNVKTYQEIKDAGVELSINRNILECKDNQEIS